MAEDERQCRLCLQSGDSDENRLFSPCQCNGSLAYIHEECLEQWRQSGSNSKSYWECPVCLYQYRYHRVPLYRTIVHWVMLLLLTACSVACTLGVGTYSVRWVAFVVDPTAMGLTESDTLWTVTPECLFVAFLITGIAAFAVGVADGELDMRDLRVPGNGVCLIIAIIGVCYFAYRAFVKLRVKLRQAQRLAGDHVLEVKKRQ